MANKETSPLSSRVELAVLDTAVAGVGIVLSNGLYRAADSELIATRIQTALIDTLLVKQNYSEVLNLYPEIRTLLVQASVLNTVAGAAILVAVVAVVTLGYNIIQIARGR